MPRFVPIIRLDDLPNPSTVEARETYVLDFKHTVDPQTWWELAKDMAAFANALGGVIIVGTTREEEPLDYPGLPPDIATRIHATYESVANEHLSPRPVVDAVLLARGDGNVVIAINVFPYAEPVGARLPKLNKNNALVPYDAWQFPIRVGRHTRPLEPAMIPMLTNAVVRRTVILLESIPKPNTQGYRDPQIVWRNPRNQSDEKPVRTDVQIVEILPDRNVFAAKITKQPDWIIRIPLDDVQAVWEATAGEWRIRVAGAIVADRPEYISNPSNMIIRT